MPVTLEEVQKFIEENDGDMKQIVSIVAETTEGKELLTNHAKAHFDENIGSRVSEIHTQYDNDAFEILGERKAGDQKTYEFLKDKLQELKDAKAQLALGDDAAIAAKEKEIEDLKKKLEDGSGDKHWHNTFKESQKAWETKETEYQTTINDLKQSQIQGSVGNDLSQGLATIKINPNIPKEAADALISQYKGEAIANAKIGEDGKVTYYHADGKPMMTSDYKPMTAADFWAEKLAPIMEKAGTPGGGAPKGKAGEIVTVGEGDAQTKKLVLDRSKFVTKEQFQKEAAEVLTAQGIATTDKLYNQLKDAAYVEYKVSELPIK